MAAVERKTIKIDVISDFVRPLLLLNLIIIADLGTTLAAFSDERTALPMVLHRAQRPRARDRTGARGGPACRLRDPVPPVHPEPVDDVLGDEDEEGVLRAQARRRGRREDACAAHGAREGGGHHFVRIICCVLCLLLVFGSASGSLYAAAAAAAATVACPGCGYSFRPLDPCTLRTLSLEASRLGLCPIQCTRVVMSVLTFAVLLCGFVLPLGGELALL